MQGKSAGELRSREFTEDEWQRAAQAAAVGASEHGMHPTGESANAIRKVECLSQCFPAGDAGR